MIARVGRRLTWGLALLATGAIAMSFGAPGCDTGLTSSTTGTTTGSTTGDGGDGTAGRTVNGEISSLRFDVEASGEVFDIRYSVPEGATNIRAFYAEFLGAGGVGEKVFVAEDLPAGADQQFQLNTSPIPVGVYKVGLVGDNPDGSTFEILSVGNLRIEGLPSPAFILVCVAGEICDPPLANRTAVAGAQINVKFDAGDPEGNANWRLFFLREEATRSQLPDVLGNLIAVGSSIIGDEVWDTANVPAGRYVIGVSVTDTGLSVAGAVQAGQTSRIRTAFAQVAGADVLLEIRDAETSTGGPTLVISAPSSDVTVLSGKVVDVIYAATSEAAGDPDITLFFDDDRVADNGTLGVLARPTELSGTAGFDTGSVSAGTFFIGGSISDGVSPPVFADYAPGSVTVITDPTLAVDEPAGGGETVVPLNVPVSVSWSTNVPSGAALVDVFAKLVPPGGSSGAGNEIPVLAPSATSVQSVQFVPEDTPGFDLGVFEISVRLVFTDSERATMVRRAAGLVRIIAAPTVRWLGAIGEGLAAEIYQGVNFEDNAGSTFAPAGDLNGDGQADFVVGARYGKPFFQAPSGIGIGEAYVIFGGEREDTTHNLNSVGTANLAGVTLTGIRPANNAQEETDGLSTVRQLPDRDGDGRSELMFGFPFVDSRGHTVNAGVGPTLEKPGQFRRGGVTILASTNSLLTGTVVQPGGTVVNLDLVGQNFVFPRVQPEATDNPFEAADSFFGACTNLTQETDDQGNQIDICEIDFICDPTQSGIDTLLAPVEGFSRALADSYTFLFKPFTNLLFPHTDFDTECVGFVLAPTNVCRGRGGDFVQDTTENVSGDSGNGAIVGSGYYPFTYAVGPDPEDERVNTQLEPFGARIIGADAGTFQTGDRFGTSISMSGDFLLVSAPNHSVTLEELSPLNPVTPPSDAGVTYLFDYNLFWPPATPLSLPLQDVDTTLDITQEPPWPYQYQIGANAPCFRRGNAESIAAPIRIVGDSGDKIELVEGIADFNGDGRDDFAVGAPRAGGGNGAVYIAYRRAPGVEGDYLLGRLGLDPNDPARLRGSLITGRTGEGFGAVLAGGRAFNGLGVDLNGDGMEDLVVGNPNASNLIGEAGAGEVVIIFGDPDLITPADGLNVDDLIATGGAARITGLRGGDHFGFNVAIAGDVDGDGLNDLLVAAPDASPWFDSFGPGSPQDGSLDAQGIDLVNNTDPTDRRPDGVADDLNGNGVPDEPDLLIDAGIVYVILGKNVLGPDPETGAGAQVSVEELGTRRLLGSAIVGRRGRDLLDIDPDGDHLGGGIEGKRNRRSFGLSAAGDVDGDGQDDFLIGAVLADPRGRTNAGEAYLVRGFKP